MNWTASTDPFLRRLIWITIAIAAILVVWHALSWTDRALVRRSVALRAVTPRGDLAEDERATIELFDRSRDAVVFITTSEQIFDFRRRNIFTIPRGTGTGFIWDTDGHIITNYHVVEGTSEARVRLTDGKEYKARLVGTSQMHDLAVLKISGGTKLHPLPLGTSRDLKVGQKVFAIGNPFGLDWSLTTGIVSALDRSLKGDSNGAVEHLIQTDAAINPGDSGGPLLDSGGRLIGVTTAIYSPSGASAGVGFAVPVDTVNRVVPQLISKGKYVSPSLGFRTDRVLNDIVTERLGIKGVLVLEVAPGSPAAAEGFRSAKLMADGTFIPGDIVTEINGKPVESVQELLSRLDDFKAGETVTITLLRNHNKITRQLPLRAE
jgi:S1-C subfamily serine protease